MSAENPDQLVPPVHELDRRRSNGLEVILWWVEGTMDTYVEVCDEAEQRQFIVATPADEMALNVFRHPFAFKAAEDRQLQRKNA